MKILEEMCFPKYLPHEAIDAYHEGLISARENNRYIGWTLLSEEEDEEDHDPEPS